GDLLHRETLAGPLKGADGFYILTTPYAKGWDDPNFEAEVRQGRSAMDAARSARTSHVILASATDGDEGSRNPVFAYKASNERHLRDKGLPGTILRPAVFMENFLSPWSLQQLRLGVLSFPGRPETRLELVAVQDIGEVGAIAFERPHLSIGHTIDLTGDTRTLGEIAVLLSAAAGRPIHVAEPQEGKAGAWTGGDDDPDPPGYRDKIERDIRENENRWGVVLTRFDDFLKRSHLSELIKPTRSPRRSARPRSKPIAARKPSRKKKPARTRS
ncbi:MAG: NmrA family NAD(P)-binding protein, partial [Thermoplasmata archaeon]